MKITNLLFATLAIMATSCSKDADVITPDAPVAKTFTVSVPAEEITRTTIAPIGDGNYSMEWSNGDKIGVYIVA